MASPIELLLLAQASSSETVWFSTSATTINSTTAIAIAGLSTTLAPNSYLVAGSLRVVAAASGTAQAFRIQFNGTCTVSGCRIHCQSYQEAGSQSINASIAGSLGSDGVDTGSMANNGVYDVDFAGIIQVATAGTFGVYGRQATSAADETFSVQLLSWMAVIPVVPQ